jgi:hypothetical protein
MEHDQQDFDIGQPADEVVQELFRGFVNPVQILKGQDQRAFLAAPDDQIP